MTFVSHLENIVFEEFSSNDNILNGEVISVKDGVAFVTGLPNRRIGELVQFLNKDFGDDQEISQDDCVKTLGRLVDVLLEKIY